MKGLLLPLGLLALGTGGGVGAGLLLAPPPAPAGEEAGEAATCPPPDHPAGLAPTLPAADGQGPAPGTRDYVRLSNQFVVPVMRDGAVAALVLLSLSVETASGQEEAVRAIEPKLRDTLLQVLFDHANAGGFEGVFTAASAMRGLRAALSAAAREQGGGLVTDVLVTDLVRQDV
jgi:flagellar FliL protein